MVMILAYIVSVAAINVAFSAAPELDLLWSGWVGFLFVLRDFVQRRLGHGVVLPMLIACLLTYVVTLVVVDPAAAAQVAFASTAAFAASELADWLVYSSAPISLANRVLLSSMVSTPIDTVVFGGIMDILYWDITVTAIASKMVGAVLVWWLLRRSEPATA